MKKILFFFTIISLPVLGFSQVDLLNRIEFEPSLNEFGHRIVTAKDHGFLVYTLKRSETDIKEEKDASTLGKVKTSDDKTWEFIKYNDKFEEEKRIEFGVPLNLFYATVFQDEHKIYFFYQNSLGKDKNDFLVLTVNIHTLNYHTFKGNLPPASIMTRFFVTEDRVFLAGWEDEKPFMTFINLKGGEIKNIPLPSEKKDMYSVHSFSQAHDGNVFIVLKSKENKKKQLLEYRLWVYSKNGTKKQEIILFNKDEGFFIDDINIIHQNQKGKYLVIGGYRSYKKNNLRGVYSMIIDEKTTQKEVFNTFDFYDFEHFFDKLEIADRNTKLHILEKKFAKRDHISYLWSFHDIEKTAIGYLLIGEVYFPHFTKDKKGHFKGNLYTHAILMHFDNEGKLVWDNLYEMDIQNPVMAKQIFLTQTNREKKIQLLCYDGGDVKGANFENGIKLLQFKEPLGTGKDYEKVLSHGKQELIHWFDDYYLLSGKQRILDKNTNQERSVYFIDCLKRKEIK